jgi:hypothetical protein
MHYNAGLWGVFSKLFRPNPLYVPLVECDPTALRLVWLLLAGSLGLLTLAVAVGDRSPERVDRSFALLLVGSIVFCPLGWTYYLWLPLGPLTALLCSWARRPEPVWRSWRWRLIALVLPAVLVPFWMTAWLQPSAVATVLLGNVYAWSLLALWLALVLDGLPHVRWPLRTAEPALAAA